MQPTHMSPRPLTCLALLAGIMLLGGLPSLSHAQDVTGFGATDGAFNWPLPWPLKTAKPLGEVRYLGAKHLSNDELDAATGLVVGEECDPVALECACLAIAQKYHEIGRPFAGCVLVLDGKLDDDEVVFQITEGPRVVVSSVAFTGNDFVSGNVLKTHCDTAKHDGVAVPGIFDQAKAETDASKLENYYRNFGFLDVRVSCEFQWAVDAVSVALVYHVQEGRRYKIKAAPQTVGNKVVSDEELRRLSRVKIGDYYDGLAIEGDRKRIEDYYGYQGRHVCVQVNNLFSPEEPGLVTPQYEFQEQPPDCAGPITIIGNVRKAIAMDPQCDTLCGRGFPFQWDGGKCIMVGGWQRWACGNVGAATRENT